MNQKERIATLVVLTLIAVVAPLAMCQPWKVDVEHVVPQPALSPIVPAVIEEVPGVDGYMLYLVRGPVEGVAYTKRELRIASSGQLLATQFYTTSASLGNIITDTIVPMPLKFVPWENTLTETAEVWLQSKLVIERLHGTSTETLEGIWCSDLDTPTIPVDNFYLVETLTVFKLYFPMAFK